MQQLLQRLVLPLAQRASGLALFYEMLEVIDKSKKARQFAYTFLFLAFIFGIRPADLWQPSNRTL